MGDSLGPKLSDRHRGVVDMWRLSVREVLLYTNRNRPTMGLTLNGPFREVVGLGS